MEDIIVFGHGRYYKSKAENLKKKYNVIAFIDNAVKVDTQLNDDEIPIYNPTQSNKLPEVPIFIMSANYFEMAIQLIELGIDESRICFGTSITPYYDNVEKFFCDLKCYIEVKNKMVVLNLPQKKYEFGDELKYKETLRKVMLENDPYIKMIIDMPLKPMSRRFGLEYGKAVDRFYIEKFLNDNRKYITGNVMEIAESTYTNMFGENVKNALSLHVNGWGKNCIKGNLETGEGIIENSVDCLIFTQTLEHIYNIRETIKNIYRMLKKEGTALITVAGIKQISLYDYYNWGEYWRFTKQTMYQLLTDIFEVDKVEVISYGNIKTTFAMLYGVCQEQLKKEDFDYNDEQYPLIIAAKVRK